MSESPDYVPIFLAESRDYLQGLNLALVTLEQQPGDPAAMQEMFRVCHSLKGMSAMMGFEQIARLAHSVEDALQLLRSGRVEWGQEQTEALFSSVDALEALVTAIEQDGAEPAGEIAQIEHLRTVFTPTSPAPTADAEKSADVELPSHLPDLVHLHVQLADDTQLPSARAFMVKRAAAEHGELVQSVPDDVRGYTGRAVELWFTDMAAAERVRENVRRLPEVESVVLVEESLSDAEAGGSEQSMVASAASPRLEQSVRVDAARLDELMFLMQEVLVARARVEEEIERSGATHLRDVMEELSRQSQQMQALVMQVRMTPVETAFARLPRLVRDLAARFGKQVELQVAGGDTEVDRSVIDVLADPLVHLVRNALDHGIEPPAEREAAGKPRMATLTIRARHSAGQVVISVSDDGRGIDPEALIERAVATGVIDETEAQQVRAAPADAFNLVFQPGVTTAAEASDISGRGVGLDSVRATALDLGGDVTISSEAGTGSTFSIRLPLTLAIMSVLLVDAGKTVVAIPLDRVERIEPLDNGSVRRVGDDRMLTLAKGMVPLLDLAVRLGQQELVEPRYAVLVHSRGTVVGVEVGGLRGQRDLVTRPLPHSLDREGLALMAAGLLPNGDIALIADCDALGAQARAATVSA